MHNFDDWDISFIISSAQEEIKTANPKNFLNREHYNDHIQSLNALMDKTDPERAFREMV